MLLRRLLPIAAAAALAACSNAPPPQQTAPVAVTDTTPIVIAANGPQIDDRSVISDADPHVERLMPVKLDQSLHDWAVSRLHGSGVGDKTLKVLIKDASVIEKVEPKQGGLTGLFTDDVDADYIATADVEVQVVDAGGQVLARSEATVSHTRSILQRYSLAERNKVWTDLVTGTVQDLDQRLSGEVRKYLASYLVAN